MIRRLPHAAMDQVPNPSLQDPVGASVLSSPQKRISVLDGFRAVAILLVLFAHTTGALPSLDRYTKMIHSVGGLGVNLFLVLSGYLITSLLLKEYQKHGTIDYLAFFSRRVRRIFPAYYAYLGVIGILALLPSGIHISFRQWLMDALYLNNYVFGFRDWWISHSWSLSIQEQFYLLWPVILIVFGLRNALRFAIGCMLLCPLLRVATYAFVPSLRDFVTILTPTRVDVLMYGCALALLLAQQNNTLIPFLMKRANAVLATAFFLIVIGTIAEFRLLSLYKLTVGYSIVGIATAALIVHLVTIPQSFVARALSIAPMLWIGRISYSLYIWQQLFLTRLNTTFVGHLPINLIAVFLVASASYYLVELPFLKYRTPVKEREAVARVVETSENTADGTIMLQKS
jgi:peptidoglycan/LPS O-acetylase OafA/YrhL